MTTPSSPTKYIPMHRRNTSDSSAADAGEAAPEALGAFKYSPAFDFSARNGSPPKHYPAYDSPPKSGFQNALGAYNSKPDIGLTKENGLTPIGEFKSSPAFSFTRPTGQSPPKHYAYGSPPKPAPMHRRRSSAADQSSNWRVPKPVEATDATEGDASHFSPNSATITTNPASPNSPTHTTQIQIQCPKSMSQLRYGPNSIPSAQQCISSFGKAEQIMAFSYTHEHRQEFNDDAMRWFVEPRVGADLNRGLEKWKADSEWRGGIGDLLRAVCRAKWAVENKGSDSGNDHGDKDKDKDKGNGKVEKFVMPDLIAWRGNITKIFLAPYAHHKTDSWELNAMLLNGTMYLHPHTSEERRFDRDIKHLSPELQQQTYHGFTFEKYCQVNKPPPPSGDAVPEPSAEPEDVSVDGVEWCTVVRTTLGDMSMIVGAEVDCIKGEYTAQPDCYMELKTVHTPQDAHDNMKFNRKALRYYLQSAAVGIPEIVIGYRSKEGILESLGSFQTADLPSYVFGQDGGWNPGLPLTWGHQALTVLRGVMMQQNSPKNNGAVWRMAFDMETSAITIRQLEGQEVEAIVNGRNYVGFLPKWYWNEMVRGEEEGEGQV